MKLISWNVNGLRACIQKGFLDFFREANADFFCLQETKLQEGQLALDLPGYHQYWCYAEKKGYSGTAIFAKHKPISVSYGLDVPELDTEGRLITLEYPEFFLVTCYTPNSQRELARIDHRLRWEEALRGYLTELDRKKPVIFCGDLNVAHQEIDLKNPKANRESAGFSDREREAFGQLLDCGFTDIFRHLHPTDAHQYTWWSYMYNARANNAGWRIDYFLVSDRLQEAVYKTPIYTSVMGSDHCPVGLELDLACHGSIWQSSAPPGEPSVIQKTAAAPKKSKALLGILAAALLLTGFSGGYLLRGTIAAITAQTQAAKDYASLTTQELVEQALDVLEITALPDSERYAKLREQNPVLAELELRSDAISCLGLAVRENSASGSISTERARTAFNLMHYYQENQVIPEDTNIYASMHTQELLDQILSISELRSYDRYYKLDTENYTRLRSQNPALAELERREDAMAFLLATSILYGESQEYDDMMRARSADALIDYYNDIGHVFGEQSTPGTDIGIAIDYASMSTQELVNIAVTIPELAAYGSPATSAILTEAAYQELAEQNPVLYELEQRPDCRSCLSRVAAIDTGRVPSESQQQTIYAAICLLSYYSRIEYSDVIIIPIDPTLDPNIGIEVDPSWADDRRVYEEGASYTIYEYTRAPSYGYSEVTMPGNTEPMQTMTFEGEPLALTTALEWIRDSNFWVRIETQDTYLYQSPELTVTPEYNPDEMLLHITPYYDTYGTKRGLMVFGYVQEQYALWLEYPNGTALVFPVCPTPPEDATTLELLEYAVRQTNLMEYIRDPNGQDVCTYLPMRLLLEREDFFPTLLNVLYDGQILGKGLESGSIYYDCNALMKQSLIQEQCPADILKAYKMISNQDYLTYRDLTRPNIVFSNQNNLQSTNYVIETIPDSLAQVLMDQWNFCTRVELKPGAECLPIDQWHLEIQNTWENLGQIGIIPYYRLEAGEKRQGWLITGIIDETKAGTFRLRHGDTILVNISAVFVKYLPETT